MIEKLIIALKGMFIGGTMLVPGVSGGSMAMILGIYDELISAVSSFLKNIKKNILFLAIFAKPLGILLEKFPVVLMYFFIGAVAGSSPMMLRKAEVKKISWRAFVYPAIGIAAVRLISMIPKGVMTAGEKNVWFYIMLILTGVIVAIALILPGISVSHMMLMLGLYDTIIEIINKRDIMGMISLAPLGIGLALGIIFCTKFLEAAMSRKPQATYLIIFGFLLGSLIDKEVFPGFPTGWQIPVCILLFALGFVVIFMLCKAEEKREAAKTQEEALQS